MSTKQETPSDLELQILSVLWEDEPVPVRDILAKLPDGKSRAYTTILSSLQVMERKGLVTRERTGKTDQWSSRFAEKAILGSQVARLVKHGFSGRRTALLQCLFDGEDFAESELDEIEALLQQHRKTKTPTTTKKSS